MPPLGADRLLAMLRDANVESRDVAAAAGVPREEAARASRLVLGIAGANAEEASTLPGPLAAAVARAALDAGRGDLLATLAGHPEKDASKEAKRGLHILRSRGVAVPEPARPAAPAPPVPPPEPPLSAFVTAVDGRGERAVWLPRAVPGKGVEVAQAVLSDTAGLVELQIGAVGRKEWRHMAAGLVERGAAMGVVEVDRERALSLVHAARALNDRSGRPVPQAADPWLARLGPAAPPPDLAAELPPLPGDEEREALAASGALHELPLMRSWMADEDFLRGVAARLDEISVSPLYIDERQRAEQMEGTVADAVDAYFDPERRRLVAARLFDVAVYLRDQGDRAHAGAAAAAARALLAGAPAGAIPFARLLVEKAFPREGSPAPEPRAGAAAESPLIVPPR